MEADLDHAPVTHNPARAAAWAQIAVLMTVQRLYDERRAAGLGSEAETAFFTRLIDYLTASESS